MQYVNNCLLLGVIKLPSGGKTYLGRITKQGSKWLMWILVESAHHAARESKRFGSLHKRVAQAWDKDG